MWKIAVKEKGLKSPLKNHNITWKTHLHTTKTHTQRLYVLGKIAEFLKGSAFLKINGKKIKYLLKASIKQQVRAFSIGL